MKTRDVQKIATLAVREQFSGRNWSKEAMDAAKRVADGDKLLAILLALKVEMLPESYRDEKGVKCPFLHYEKLNITTRR